MLFDFSFRTIHATIRVVGSSRITVMKILFVEYSMYFNWRHSVWNSRSAMLKNKMRTKWPEKNKNFGFENFCFNYVSVSFISGSVWHVRYRSVSNMGWNYSLWSYGNCLCVMSLFTARKRFPQQIIWARLRWRCCRWFYQLSIDSHD